MSKKEKLLIKFLQVPIKRDLTFSELETFLIAFGYVKIKGFIMASTIEHNGYIGSVEYSAEDKCFFGKLEMIDDLVTFEANNANDLEINFQDAVDGYLSTCKELNREPQKAYKGVFNVRIDPDLHKKVATS